MPNSPRINILCRLEASEKQGEPKVSRQFPTYIKKLLEEFMLSLPTYLLYETGSIFIIDTYLEQQSPNNKGVAIREEKWKAYGQNPKVLKMQCQNLNSKGHFQKLQIQGFLNYKSGVSVCK